MAELSDSSSSSERAAWARTLAVSREAIDVYAESEVIDLHVDSFIWTRLFGYDLSQRHGTGLFAARYYSQVDFPRMREVRIGGALWSITTNPLRRPTNRARAFARYLKELQ